MLKKAKVVFYLNDISEKNKKAFAEKLAKLKVNFMPEEDEAIKHIVNFLPPGTILAKSFSAKEKADLICLPLLSSHISLPLKQGEFVWYSTDEDAKKNRNDEKNFYENHPLLSFNDYWISRIHGTLISEDLNYAHKPRDRLVKKAKVSKEDLDNPNNIKIPGYDEENVFVQTDVFTSEIYEEGIDNQFGSKLVPRMFSKTDDLTIQGSYNTLINFTNNNTSDSQTKSREGIIDIVAGRLSFQDFYEDEVEEDEIVDFGKRSITNSSNKENKVDNKEFKLSKNKVLKITNASGGEEVFKSPEFYLNEEFQGLNSNEGNIDFIKDASRIMINEAIDIDSDVYYDTSFIKDNTFKLEETGTIITNLISKSYLNNTIYSIENFEVEEIEEYITFKNKETKVLESMSLPTIFLKTNNIRMISRKELKNEEKLIPSGSIRLIKEDNNYLNYSHLLMENNGDVFINGNNIFIGDFRKEILKLGNHKDIQALTTEIDSGNFKLEIDNPTLKSMHGQGFGVLLGYEENLSEPLVLGNTLVAFLKEILNIFVQSLESIRDHEKSLVDNLNKDHIIINTFMATASSQLAPLGITIPVISVKENYTNIDLEKNQEIAKLKLIINNLTDILSRFSKTS